MKTNPTQCFTKKNEFGFALFGGPEGIRTLDLSDANRTLSQLSYKPEYEVVWLRYVRLALPAELQAHNYPIIIHILRENARAFSGFFSLGVQYC